MLIIHLTMQTALFSLYKIKEDGLDLLYVECILYS